MQSFFSDLPARFTENHLNSLLVKCYEQDVSDITLQTGEEIFVEQYGKLFSVMQRRLLHYEVTDILHHVYGPNGSAQLLSGQDIDTNYDIRPSRKIRYRFRVNGTGCLVDGHHGIQITFRVIPTTPPTLDALSLEKNLLHGLSPLQGVVYVTGSTGSGKTTLLAAIIRYLAEQKHSHRKILTYEAPIEFVYDEINTSHAIISQVEIPKHLPSFTAGIRNALRRKPHLILVGEARDTETIQAVIEAALMGHPIYTTLHSSGVAQTVRRLLGAFKEEERQKRAVDIIETTSAIVWQQLIPSIDGKRTAIREFLIFTKAIRQLLLETPTEQLVSKTRELVVKFGKPIHTALKEKLTQGIITEEIFYKWYDQLS